MGFSFLLSKNPGEYQESVHTVSLAARSRHISNFVHSAQKQDTPNVKIDMEAKLQSWLESKGKTKSAQRPVILSSPFLSKTPGSVRSIKKLDKCQSLSKQNTTIKQGVSDLKQRYNLKRIQVHILYVVPYKSYLSKTFNT